MAAQKTPTTTPSKRTTDIRLLSKEEQEQQALMRALAAKRADADYQKTKERFRTKAPFSVHKSNVD